MSLSDISLGVDRLLSITEARVDAEHSAEAVEAVRRDGITLRITAKKLDIFLGSLQKRVSGNASIVGRVGPATVL